ncbi:hypothetical protein C8R45DRAFT_1211727 [Mycena sanguinolenta]|nr:hypothetical protein C8R45DRAFT_1211727 [Mycena sanguinolenta]
MENTFLSAKSGGQWTFYELEVLNISIEDVDVPSFFGSALSGPEAYPTLLAHPVLLSNETRPAGVISKEDRYFFHYLQDVTLSSADSRAKSPCFRGLESAMIDFSAWLLQFMDYDEPEGAVHRRVKLDLIMRGQQVKAGSNVVVLNDDDDYSLVLQHHPRHAEAEPRLIAAAIAAHYENNRRRAELGLPTVANKVYAGIIMTGSAPTFYQIPVSETLVAAVRRGQCPSEPTIVKKLRPPVDDMREYIEKGMESLPNRRLILQCLAAFKQFVQ